MTDGRSKWHTGAALASVLVLGAFAAERNAGAAESLPEVNIHEHRTQPVPSLGPLTVHVWQRGTEIQVAALDERGAMVVLRSGTIHDGASSDTTPMQGVLTARTRTIGKDGALVVDECASSGCAQAIAVHASALASQATFIKRIGRPAHHIAVRMCPTAGDGTEAIATNAGWAWAGAYAPCKWRIVPAAAFAAWPLTERSARVRVGDTVFQMHRAALKPVHGG